MATNRPDGALVCISSPSPQQATDPFRRTPQAWDKLVLTDTNSPGRTGDLVRKVTPPTDDRAVLCHPAGADLCRY